MKKLVCCFFLIASLLIITPCNADHTIIPADDDDICAILEENMSQMGFDYFSVVLNREQEIIVINVAIDGLTEQLLTLKENGIDETFEQWVQVKETMLFVHASILDFFETVHREDLRLVLNIVNDDAYIREDYSTISHNPLLCIGVQGFIMVDEMKEY